MIVPLRVPQLIDTYAGVRFLAPDVAFDDAEKSASGVILIRERDQI